MATFVVAGGQGAVLLTARDQALDAVAQPVDGAVEGAAAVFGAQLGDGVADASPSQIRPPRAAGVALVADHPPRPQPRAAASWSRHRALFHELGERGHLAAPPRREHQRQRLAAALRTEVNLRRAAAAAAAKRLRRRVPPFAPAACWCARTVVPSTK